MENEKTKFRLSLSKLSYGTKKEAVKNIKRISYSLGSKSITDLDINTFCEKITNGHSWCPNLFSKGRQNQNWIGAQSIALDIDDGLTPIEALEICEKINLPPTVIYNSYSDTPELRKFRVVWILDSICTDWNVYRSILMNLITLFGADSQCKDAARLYFSGKEVLHKENNAFCLSDFVDNKLIVSELQTKVYTSGHTPINIGNSSAPARLYFSSQSTDIQQLTTNFDYRKHKVRRFDFNKACELSQYLSDFRDGNGEFSHGEHFALHLNLRCIKGGEDFYINSIKNNAFESKKQSKINIAYSNRKYRHYPPISLKSFGCCVDFIGDLKVVRNAPKRLTRESEVKTISITEASFLLKEAFKDFQDNEVCKIIKAPTGLGKSEVALRLAYDEDDVIFAAPTHNLKDELYIRFKKMFPHGDAIRTPRPPKLPPYELTQYNRFLSRKEYAYAHLFLSSLLGDSKKEVERWKKEWEKVKSFDGLIFTTHAQVRKFENKTVIIDEDYISNVLQTGKISFDKVEKFVNNEKIKNQEWKNFYAQFLSDECLIDGSIDAKQIQDDSFVKLAFAQWSRIYEYEKDGKKKKEIWFVSRESINDTNKYLVMSATINKLVYEKLFNTNIVEIPETKLKGKIYQTANQSYSQSKASKREKAIEIINNSNLETITHKRHKNLFKNKSDVHYWNCTGIDTIKGDIIVYGDPNPNPMAVILQADGIGIGYKTTDFKEQLISRNGCAFWYNTFIDENLRSIHLDAIESEILQAVGRARLVRQDRKVFLFSRFPLAQSELISMEDMEEQLKEATPQINDEGMKRGTIKSLKHIKKVLKISV